MNCSDIQGKLGDYIDDIVVGEERALIISHLDTCEACRREHLLLGRSVASVKSLSRVSAPAGFAEKVAGRLRSRSAVSPNKSRLSFYIACLAASLVAFLLGWAVYPSLQRASIKPQPVAEGPALAKAGKENSLRPVEDKTQHKAKSTKALDEAGEGDVANRIARPSSPKSSPYRDKAFAEKECDDFFGRDSGGVVLSPEGSSFETESIELCPNGLASGNLNVRVRTMNIDRSLKSLLALMSDLKGEGIMVSRQASKDRLGVAPKLSLEVWLTAENALEFDKKVRNDIVNARLYARRTKEDSKIEKAVEMSIARQGQVEAKLIPEKVRVSIRLEDFSKARVSKNKK